MTEQEAMFCLKAESERYPEICNECPLYGEVGCDHCFDDAMDVAIKALEEIQQYRAIGTLEECRRENMKAEQIMEVVDKLVGEIKPIGDSNYDDKVKENLKTMIEIVGYYVDEICEIAEMNSYCASIQDCSAIARDFINGLKDAYESLNYTY